MQLQTPEMGLNKLQLPSQWILATVVEQDMSGQYMMLSNTWHIGHFQIPGRFRETRPLRLVHHHNDPTPTADWCPVIFSTSSR